MSISADGYYPSSNAGAVASPSKSRQVAAWITTLVSSVALAVFSFIAAVGLDNYAPEAALALRLFGFVCTLTAFVSLLALKVLSGGSRGGSSSTRYGVNSGYRPPSSPVVIVQERPSYSYSSSGNLGNAPRSASSTSGTTEWHSTRTTSQPIYPNINVQPHSSVSSTGTGWGAASSSDGFHNLRRNSTGHSAPFSSAPSSLGNPKRK